MFNLKHVLAIVDFRQKRHFALPRAIELAHQFGCEVTVTANTYESFLDFIPTSSAIDREQIKQEAIEQNDARLKALVTEQDVAGLKINYRTIWNASFHQGLSEYINEQSFDLVLKTAHSHNAIKKLMFTPTDWHLLRDTRTNILFVKEGKWPDNSIILGAINVEDDKEHQALNRKIISMTAELAKSCNSKSSILNVFPWPMVHVQKFKHMFDKDDLFLTIKADHETKVLKAVEDVTKISGKVIVAEGLEPEETIPQLVQSMHAPLLVMGTVGRKGLGAAMIGNMAERILDELQCEVLTVK